MMPSLFLAHGSPMIALQENAYTNVLSEIGKAEKPEAIVIFTAHWETPVLTISSVEGEYETIYDFGGFPEELYQMKYPAKGSPDLAKRLSELLKSANIDSQFDHRRGLDHGSWTLLKHLYPDADIPVVQVSVQPFLPLEQQFKIGEAIRSLGEDHILVIGSGVTVHNLRQINWGATEVEEWAVQFDSWLEENMLKGDYDTLFRTMEEAPHAQRAVPRPEHFIPLFIAMGAGNRETPDILFKGYELGSISYLSAAF
ncbi:dioxygenase [Domibacillus antri]|uniref:Dioxygenase n=1 Tax=Domibacillus antri TaxID=1714264 RepID=A0A1Q8Q8A6_9BACI|nr:class III extradiol ring-cleavage dioxygenase [Domibacillus antri]OLN23579.1 dioxygenase [Domibacillus antri]